MIRRDQIGVVASIATTAWNRGLYGAVRGGQGAAAAKRRPGRRGREHGHVMDPQSVRRNPLSARHSRAFRPAFCGYRQDGTVAQAARPIAKCGVESAEPRPTAPQLTKDDWQPFEAGGDRRKSNNGRWCFYFAKMGQCRSLSEICVTGSGQLIAKRGSS